MLDRYGVVEGTSMPLMVETVGQLPEQLLDVERLELKLKSDQQKLYAIVEYVRFEGDRKAFIHEYFGLA